VSQFIFHSSFSILNSKRGDMENEVPAVGQKAPEFDLPAAIGDSLGERISLSLYRGHTRVVLAFYVLDWTST
jgi:peroxiredoxin